LEIRLGGGVTNAAPDAILPQTCVFTTPNLSTSPQWKATS